MALERRYSAVTRIAHVPVLLDEVLASLVPPRPDALMLDCTLGEGGHALAFLSRYPSLRYVGIDADEAIQAKARERLAGCGERLTLILGYFDEALGAWAEGPAGGARPDLVLFDLGISMFHFAESGRGFAYSGDEALDMRLSPSAPKSAADLLAEESEEELARIMFEYGEERFSRRIARAIVEARRSGRIGTAARLAEIVRGAVPYEYRHGRIHPATRTFQSLRIAVNDELGRAERGIRAAMALLAPGGTIAVISFHSLEDRIAKNLFRERAAKRPERKRYASARSVPDRERPISEVTEAEDFEILTRKPIEPSSEEMARNPASRSAKLRVARKIRIDAEKADA